MKEGFAWLALITPTLWVLYHRLWWVLLGLICVGVLIAIIPALVTGDTAAATYSSLLVNLIMGFVANDLRRWTLARRGFVEVATVQAANRDAAEFRYFSNWDAGPILPQPVSAPPSAKPTEQPGPWRPQGPAKPPATSDDPAVIGMFPEPEGGR